MVVYADDPLLAKQVIKLHNMEGKMIDYGSVEYDVARIVVRLGGAGVWTSTIREACRYNCESGTQRLRDLAKQYGLHRTAYVYNRKDGRYYFMPSFRSWCREFCRRYEKKHK